jgi:chitinase
MIGQNDTSSEIFTLADASTVESYAAQRGIALLSFWAEGRDNGGCPNAGYASSTCSGISQSSGAFTQAFQPFTSGGTITPPTTTPPTTTPPTTTPPTTGSCAAAWVNNVAYVSGNEVSYNGDNWTANQWNYDEVPGGVNGAWNNDGAC